MPLHSAIFAPAICRSPACPRSCLTARILRERYGYFGEIRAVGNVLRDQLSFMSRCGFDAVELSSDAAEENWRVAMSEIDGNTSRLLEAVRRRKLPPDLLRGIIK